VAKPDLDDGYLRLAHELFAAVCCAGFNKWEMVVLREVFDQIYGPHKFPAARLFPTAIATDADTSRQAIHRAIDSLAKSGVIARRSDGEFAFIKDYERWSKGGVPRFSRSEIGFIGRQKKSMASSRSVNNGAYTRGSDPLNASTTALTTDQSDSLNASTTALTPTATVDAIDSHKSDSLNASAPALTAVSAGADASKTFVNNGAYENGVPPLTPHSGTRAEEELIQREEEKDLLPLTSPVPVSTPAHANSHARTRELPAPSPTRRRGLAALATLAPAVEDESFRRVQEASERHRRPVA
jgi:Bacteriophage replication protein O